MSEDNNKLNEMIKKISLIKKSELHYNKRVISEDNKLNEMIKKSHLLKEQNFIIL